MRALLFALLLATHAAASCEAAYRPAMTGQKLVLDMLAEPGVGRNSMLRERAMGYIEGVMDTGAGRTWCPVGKAIPHELNYAVVEDLSRLSAEKLKGDAAALVLGALSAHYPCKQPGAK